jgi:hypothetical protein
MADGSFAVRAAQYGYEHLSHTAAHHCGCAAPGRGSRSVTGGCPTGVPQGELRIPVPELTGGYADGREPPGRNGLGQLLGRSTQDLGVLGQGSDGRSGRFHRAAQVLPKRVGRGCFPDIPASRITCARRTKSHSPRDPSPRRERGVTGSSGSIPAVAQRRAPQDSGDAPIATFLVAVEPRRGGAGPPNDG